MGERVTMDTEPQLHLSAPQRESILARLRRIEGQVKGLQRMLREERDCGEITQQLAAARAALDNVAVNLLTAGLEHCLESPAGGPRRVKAAIRKLQHSLLMLR
ncbi:MAG: metal-sensitive transcriptional regulator [Armatimonadota bacterium]|nr:metal-sensitive transcriptional regulator [Armatimonadota bacterium]